MTEKASKIETLATRTEGNITYFNFNRPEEQEVKAPTARDRQLIESMKADHTMEPLHSYDDVKAVIDYFKNSYQTQNMCIFVFGICTGLRSSDLRNLKIGDIFKDIETGELREHIDIIEQKTGKRTCTQHDEMVMTEALQKYALIQLKYIKDLHSWSKKYHPIELDHYFFQSRISYGTKPIDRKQTYDNISAGIKAVCPGVKAGTHTMRKTFLCIANAIAMTSGLNNSGMYTAMSDCQILAHHANPQTTLRYMTVAKRRVVSLRHAVSDFVLGKTKLKELDVEYMWDLDDDD